MSAKAGICVYRYIITSAKAGIRVVIMISTYLPLIMYLQPTDECYRMQGFVVPLSMSTTAIILVFSQQPIYEC